MRFLRHILLTLSTAPLISGCFLGDLLQQEEPPKPKAAATPEGEPKVKPEPPPPGQLKAPKLVRRLALDLAQNLPSQADVDLLTADPTQYARLVDAYLAQRHAARALGDLHPRMWRLDARQLPDLDAYAAAGDPTIGNALDDSFRRLLVDEPAQLVRFVVDGGLPFSTLFTGDFTIVATDALAFWNLTDDGEAWPGETYRYAVFSDDRPAAGILAANGFLAAYASRDDATYRRRTGRLLTAFACLQVESASAHTFADLTPVELASDLAELAVTRSPCAGCHAHFANTAPAFAGLGSASDFAGWRTYQAPATAFEGVYAGQRYTGLAQLGALVGADPRVHRCEVERLAGALLQRPYNERDSKPVALAMTRFNVALDLKRAARELLLADEYKVAPISTTKNASALYGASGVKVLRREQWRGVLQQLSPAAAGLTIPLALDPGVSETVTEGAFVPSGEYFRAADELARRAATLIVDAELATGVVAAGRRVLTDLPDGVGTEATGVVVQQQIASLWRRLTAETLEPASALNQALYELFQAAEPGTDDDSFKNAWRTVIVAMLTHPTFMTY